MGKPTAKELDLAAYQLSKIAGSLSALGELMQQQHSDPCYNREDMFGLGSLMRLLGFEASEIADAIEYGPRKDDPRFKEKKRFDDNDEEEDQDDDESEESDDKAEQEDPTQANTPFAEMMRSVSEILQQNLELRKEQAKQTKKDKKRKKKEQKSKQNEDTNKEEEDGRED